MANTERQEGQLSTELVHQLWLAALEAHDKAYAPYSHYRVGAAILDDLGAVHSGCNVENAAYPQGWCAEASALSAMVMAGARQVRAVVLVGGAGSWVTPCGGCRQKLREFAAPNTPIYSASPNAVGPMYLLGDLMPHSFGPDHLASP